MDINLFESFITSQNESMAVSGPINFVEFCKYLCGPATPKANESLNMAKQLEHVVSYYFQNTVSLIVATLLPSLSCRFL